MNEETTHAYSDRILVVDDTTANLQLLTNLLTAHGYTVYPASDGELALEFARSTLPDLILLDIRMPGMDGYEVCRRLKADERTRPVPIIFVSVLEDEREKVKGFQAGAVDYITKPFEPEEVLARIQIHLRLRELTERLEQKVAERTEELQAANAQLQRELAERKQAEKALLESEELLRITLENILDPVFITDDEGKFTFVCANVLVALGYTVEQIMAMGNISTLFGGRLFALDELKALGEIHNIDGVIVRKDGSRGDYLVTVKRVSIEHGTILCSCRDITDRKRAEEEILRLKLELEQRVEDRTADLEKANKELDAFAYSVSHDLRAPLRHIDGFIELLQNRAGTVFDEQSRHYVACICESVHKMELLIDDLLSFSRMGRHAMSFMQVELGILVHDVIRELELDAAGRNIEWCVGDLPSVDGDASMLRIVLANLLSNALKFTRPRQQAQIEIGSIPSHGPETVIFVRDNGVGFDMTYMDKLFGVFQRLHRSEDFEGTGIGLANVRRIINRHGGRTWAEGEVDRGATFYFSLPQPIQGA